MKPTVIFSALFLAACLLFGVQSCSSDDCGACFTPPSSFTFRMIDNTSREDMFLNGTYSFQKIVIIEADSDPQKAVELSFAETDENLLFRTNNFGWKTEQVYYAVLVDGDEKFRLFIDADRVVENCCSFTRINELRIEGAEFEFDELEGLHTILIN